MSTVSLHLPPELGSLPRAAPSLCATRLDLEDNVEHWMDSVCDHVQSVPICSCFSILNRKVFGLKRFPLVLKNWLLQYASVSFTVPSPSVQAYLPNLFSNVPIEK